jgi:hypothetical protein
MDGESLVIPTGALFVVVQSPIKKQQVKKYNRAVARQARAFATEFGGVLFQDGKPVNGILWRGKVPRIIVSWLP